MIAELDVNGAGASKPLWRVLFACGAAYEIAGEPFLDRDGRLGRVFVFTPNGEAKPPLLAGEPAPCLAGCPVKAKLSVRRELMGWVGKGAEVPKGEPVLCVLCRPVALLTLRIPTEAGA